MTTMTDRRGQAPEIIRMHDGRYLLVGQPVPPDAARALGADPHPAQAILVDGELIDGLPRPVHADAGSAEARVHAFTALWQSALPRKNIARLAFDGEIHDLDAADLVTMLEHSRALRRQAARARTVRLEPAAVPPLIDLDEHTPERIRAYLDARGWRCRHDGSMKSDWKLPGLGVLGVSVVHSTTAPDYRHAVARLVRMAAQAHHVGELAVLDDIAATQAPPATPAEPPLGATFTIGARSWTRHGAIDAQDNWHPDDGGEPVTWNHLWTSTGPAAQSAAAAAKGCAR